MILDESLFDEYVEPGKARGPYKKKELSDQEIFDKVFDKLQAKLISKHYKVGTDSNNLFVNARVVNKKLPNGRVVIKKEFLTNKEDYEDIIKYLDEANVKHEFKDSVQGLQLNILLDKDNAKDVNQEVLNRNARVKNEDLPANRFRLKKYNDNSAVIGRSPEELKELKQYYLSQVKKYNDMKAYDEAKWYQKQANWCDKELAETEMKESLLENETINKKHYIIFNHFNPEYVFYVDKLPDWIDSSDWIYEDVTGKYGQYMVEHNDENISVYEHPESLEEMDKKLYERVKKYFEENPDDDYYEDEETWLSIERDEFENRDEDDFDMYSSWVKESEVDGDSSSKKELVTFTDDLFTDYDFVFGEEDKNIYESKEEIESGKDRWYKESLNKDTATSKVIYRICGYTDNEQLSTISKDEVLKYLNAKLNHNISVYQNEVRLVKPYIDVVNFWFEDYSGVYGHSENYYKFPNTGNHFETKKLTDNDIESIERILIESTATSEELNALMINFSNADIIDFDNELFKLNLKEKSELKHFLVYRHNYCIVIAPNAELALEAINDYYSHEIRKDHVPYKLVKDAKSIKKYLGESLKKDEVLKPEYEQIKSEVAKKLDQINSIKDLRKLIPGSYILSNQQLAYMLKELGYDKELPDVYSIVVSNSEIDLSKVEAGNKAEKNNFSTYLFAANKNALKEILKKATPNQDILQVYLDMVDELPEITSIKSLNERFRLIRTIEDAQREVDEQIEKFGRIGGGLYDDLDAAGFYVDENNKVQYKIKPENESLKEDYRDVDYIENKIFNEQEFNKYKKYIRPEVILHYMYGYSPEEIAVALNMNAGTVSTRIKDNLRQVREIKRGRKMDKNLERLVKENEAVNFDELLKKLEASTKTSVDDKANELISKVLNGELTFKQFYNSLKNFKVGTRDNIIKRYADKLNESLKEELSPEELKEFEQDEYDEYKRALDKYIDFIQSEPKFFNKAARRKGTTIPSYIKKLTNLLNNKKYYDLSYEIRQMGVAVNDLLGIDFNQNDLVYDHDDFLDEIEAIYDNWKEERSKEGLKESLSPEQEKEYGLITMINSLIKDELEAIDGYNSAIVTLEAENKGEFTDVIRDIISEENKHIGQLQAILKELNPSTTADIDAGQKEGQKQIDQVVGVTKGDTEETTTTIDTEEGVIKTYKLDNVEKIEEK